MNESHFYPIQTNINNGIYLTFRNKINLKPKTWNLRLKVSHICIAVPIQFWNWSNTRSTFSLDGHEKNGPFMVISWLEIECYELTPVNSLKFRFTVLSKLSKKWHFILTLVIWKKLSYVIQFFNHKWLKCVCTFWDTLYNLTWSLHKFHTN